MVVLPFEQVPLHIFEPRYKKMIDESLKNNTPFGIVSKNNGSVDSVGCSLKVTKVIKHYESGEYDLIATGDKCFQVIERSKINDLWVGNIEYMKTPEIEDKNILKSVQNKYLELLIKLKNEKNFELDFDVDDSQIESKEKNEDIINFIKDLNADEISPKDALDILYTLKKNFIE